MQHVGFQFHSPREELVGLLAEVLGAEELYVAAEVFFPDYRVERVALKALQMEVNARPEIRRLVFSRVPITVDFTKGVDFTRANIGALFALLETVEDATLRQSSASAGSEDPATIKYWRSMLRRLKKSMRCGADTVNPRTGDRGFDRQAWYTIGAVHLYRDGIRMLGIAGDNEFELPTDEW